MNVDCFVCGKPVQFVRDGDRLIPESKYWHSVDFGPAFTEVFCTPTCMLIRHYARNDKFPPTWLRHPMS